MRIRYTVRFLLALLSLFVVVQGWLSIDASRQALLVEKIRSLGGVVVFENPEVVGMFGVDLTRYGKIVDIYIVNKHVTEGLASQIIESAARIKSLETIVLQDVVLSAEVDQRMRRDLPGIHFRVINTAPDLEVDPKRWTDSGVD